MSRPDVTLIQFRWDDHGLAQVFHALRPTVRHGNRAFPSIEQYRQATADAEQAGYHRARVLAAAQRDWHARGQNGCLFARLAALAADGLRWDYLVAEAAQPDQVGELFRECAAADGTEVLSVLVPDLTTADEVLGFVRDLVASSSFWLERDEVIDGHQVCHLRCPVSGTSADIQAWVMGFGPFDWIPNTRRGPFFELAIRVRQKAPWLFHRLNQDRDIAHLADVPLAMSSRHWEHRWRSTRDRTRMILGKEPDRFSAAKCTLAIPLEALRREVMAS